MESFDSIPLQDYVKSGFLQLFTLIIFAFLGSFFLCALITTVKEGIKEEGWFKFKIEKEEDK